MRVAEIMSSKIHVLHANQNLRDATKLFLEKHIDGAPVLNETGELIGLLGKSHLYRAISDGNETDSSVADYMEKKVRTIGPDEDINSLKNLGFGRVPVVENEQLVGMITQSDISAAFFNILSDVSQELNAVIDSAHNAIISIDAEGYIKIFNRPAERLFEMSKQKVMGCLFSEVLPEGKLMEILKSGNSQASQRFTYKDKTLLSNRSPIIINGEIDGAVAVVQDVSEVETISKELKFTQELKEQVDAIIRSSYDGIYLTDKQGKTLLINEAYSRITGMAENQLLGKNMQDLVDSGVVDRSATLMVMEKLEPITLTQEINKGKTVLVTGNPIFDKKGELSQVVTNVRDITELNKLKQEVEEAQKLSHHYREQLRQLKVQGCERYVIKSPKSRDLLDLVLRLGQVDSTVLVQGESGVGKEVIAEILHSNSIRRDKPFVRINCGAIPENLIESELFGYESGAFTGAKKGGKMGLFEFAHQGTLFLDEIGDLPLYLQVKLLRVIQEHEVTRVGGTEPISVDVRLIAATNRDLWDMVVHHQFRKDLFYRLNVVPVTIPPLRERKEEIIHLANHFMEMFNKKYHLNKSLSQRALKQMTEYEWPGNVRELENVVERSIVTTDDIMIHEISVQGRTVQRTDEFVGLALNGRLGLKEAVENLEKNLISKSLEQNGSTRKMALALGVSQPTVVRKAARYGINLQSE